MFDIVRNLTQAAVATVLLPVDMVRDVVTFGGELTNGRPNTPKRLKQIGRAVDEALER
jgi:hypothetical protein